MQWERDGPTVILSPHPDDAVLSAWKVLSSSADAQVLTVCTAVPDAGTVGSFDPLFGVSDSAAFMELRLGEDAEALASIRRTGTALGFLDHQYRDSPLPVGELGAAISGAVDQAARLVAPAAIGGHPDHVAVRSAAFELSRGGVPLSLFADLPYAARMGWPHWVTGREPRPYLMPEVLWHEAMKSMPVPADHLKARPARLTAGVMAAKLAAVRAYRTQFDALNLGPVGFLTNPEILGFELYWNVDPWDPST